MSFTYTPGSDTASVAARNRIRRLIGDTLQSAGPRRDASNFSDEEITEVTTELGTSNAYTIAAELMRVLAAEWAAVPSYTLGPHGEQAGELSAKYAARATELDRQAQRGRFYAGGLSQDRMTTVEEDDDRVAPAFTRQMDKHP